MSQTSNNPFIFSESVEYKNKLITADIHMLSNDISVSIYGGDFPHIGAVAVLTPTGEISVLEFPHHKEGIVCELWITTLKQLGFTSAVVHAGIHYDNICKNEINDILALNKQLLEKVIYRISV